MTNSKNNSNQATNDETPLLANGHASGGKDSSKSDVNNNVSNSLWMDTSRKERFLLVDVVLMQLLVEMNSCIMDPFLSRLIINKLGGTLIESAIILQIDTAAMTIFFYVFGKYTSTLGLTRLFYGGLIASGTTQILFGLLVFAPDLPMFFALGVTLRIIGGMGSAAYGIAGVTIVGLKFPKYISQVFGLFQAATGCSRFIGPAAGGLLFDKFGMLFPLVLFGAVPIITIPVHWFILPKNIGYSSTKSDFKALEHLRKPSVFISLGMIFMVYGIIGYTDVAFTMYFHKMGHSTTLVGLAMLTIGASFCIGSVVIGYISNKSTWIQYLIISVGAIAFAACMITFSPGQALYVIFIGCFFVGLTSSMAIVPAFEEQMIIANGGPVSADTSTTLYSTVSGIWFSNMGAGLTAVPIIASIVQVISNSSLTDMFYGLASVQIVFSIAKTAELIVTHACKKSES